MKRQIRIGVFETNSSSTHSVSIYNRAKKLFSTITRNSEIILDDSYSTGIEIFDELGKLNFVVTMLASIVEYKNDDDEFKIKSFDDFSSFTYNRNAYSLLNGRKITFCNTHDVCSSVRNKYNS